MTLPFKYDLHIHTSCSDGTFTPEQVLEIAKSQNLKGLSITDHDTVDAYSNNIIQKAKDLNLELITGVEFSAIEKGYSVHILGYLVDVHSELLLHFVKKHHVLRELRNREIIQKFQKKGFKISYEDLEAQRTQPNQVLGRPHIAQILLNLGHVNTIQEAFERYLGDGRSCYVESKMPSIDETIDIIHRSGGKAVIAHPQLFKKKRILKEILKKPFDGIECYYAKLGRREAENYVALAKERNWLITGGSDFHGGSKPFLYMGASFIQQEDFDKLVQG